MSGPISNDDPAAVDPLSIDALASVVAEAQKAFAQADSVADLKSARTLHLADKSPIALANRQIATLEPSQRKDAGQRIGAARAEITTAFEARQREVAAAELAEQLVNERVDVTLPMSRQPLGAPHPITALTDLMCDVFVAMGWEIAEGPEAEGEWLNFDALNIGPDHPARGTTDTLFVSPLERHVVLRTHTSPVQIRSLLDRSLPVYVVCPGTVYRADEFDATHVPVFHQIEGICVDKGISMAHLKGTLDHLAREMFGDVRTRMRPSYFPFTEPSAEIDLECFVCHGESVGNPDRPCRTCRSEGWIEWGGCGVMNPRVLAACGVDTDVYSGFAFGMGIERTLMFRNNATDMRDMVEGDIRFSRQLKGAAR